MKARVVLAAALLVLVSCRAEAATPRGVATELDEIVESWRRRTPVPAVIAMVAGPDVGEHIVASGTLLPGGSERPRPDTPFRAASITKLLVATVVLQMADERRLDLDDAAVEHLPVRFGLGDLLDGVTVRDLLGHTSGIPDASRSSELAQALKDDPQRRWSVQDVLRFVAGHDREFEPGTAYGYSNTNYLLLGEVIEALSGAPWHLAVRQRILDPLGMESSYIAGREEPVGQLAPGYFDLDNDGATQQVPARWPALETSEGAAGALVSTAPDLVKFISALADGKLLPNRAVGEMTRPGPFASRYTGYGLGVEVTRPDLETVVWGHGGVVPGFRSVLWHVPSRDVAIVVLANEARSRPDGLAELLLKAVTR